MMRWISISRLVATALAVIVALFMVGWWTREDPAEKPWLEIAGSGFLFNYRIAEVSYGFTAFVVRPLPTGSIIEAGFEDPAGGPDLLVRQRVGTGTARYGFQSPPVRGVRADTPYRVSVRILDREETTELWRHEFTVASQLDDDVMPERPLTVGPGYARNVDR